MSSGQSSKAEFAAVSAGKRRKTSNTATSSFPSLDIQNLTHLPSDQLVHIAGYLSKTSRALFATRGVDWDGRVVRVKPARL